MTFARKALFGGFWPSGPSPFDAHRQGMAGSFLVGGGFQMAVSPKIGGPQYRPPNTIILIIGTPKKGTLNFEKHPNIWGSLWGVPGTKIIIIVFWGL